MSFKTKKGTELNVISLKGKNYLPVAERILWFREENPDWTIKTTIVFSDESYSQARAEIINPEGRLIATAHKSETAKGFADHMEKAETGSIGRALALCGYGTQFTNELDEGTERIVDAPRATTEPYNDFLNPSPPKKLASPNAEFVKCAICGSKMYPSKFKEGEVYCPNKKNHKDDQLPF